MMLRGPSSFQGRCLQHTAACRSVAVCHRPVRCTAVSRRQASVLAMSRSGGRNGEKNDKEKDKGKKDNNNEEKSTESEEDNSVMPDLPSTPRRGQPVPFVPRPRQRGQAVSVVPTLSQQGLAVPVLPPLPQPGQPVLVVPPQPQPGQPVLVMPTWPPLPGQGQPAPSKSTLPGPPSLGSRQQDSPKLSTGPEKVKEEAPLSSHRKIKEDIMEPKMKKERPPLSRRVKEKEKEKETENLMFREPKKKGQRVMGRSTNDNFSGNSSSLDMTSVPANLPPTPSALPGGALTNATVTTAVKPWAKKIAISGPRYVNENAIKPDSYLAKEYWSDPATVLKATTLPIAVLNCAATDNKGTSSVLDFLKRFPVSSFDMSADASQQEHRLVCIVASDTKDIYKSTIPHMNKQRGLSLREAKREGSLPLCQLPWTCNYYFSGSREFQPGQLSNKLAQEDHNNEIERWKFAVSSTTKELDGLWLRDSRYHSVPRTSPLTVSTTEAEEELEKSRAEIQALESLPPGTIQVASKAKRQLYLDTSFTFNSNQVSWMATSNLAEPKVYVRKQYSWITRQSITLQSINAAVAPRCEAKLDMQTTDQAPQLTISNGTTMLNPPDKSQPLRQQNRVAVVHLSKDDTEALLCWAPTTVQTKDGSSVETLLMSCIKSQPDVTKMCGLMQTSSVVLAFKSNNSGQADAKASIPKPVDKYTLSRLDLKSPLTETLTVLAVWHDKDNKWRLFVQIQDIPDPLTPWLNSIGHKLVYTKEPKNTLLGAAQVYPLGYPDPSDSNKTINTIAGALQLAYACKSYVDPAANNWDAGARDITQRVRYPTASKFPRFTSTAIEASCDHFDKTFTSSISLAQVVDLAQDNDGADLLSIPQQTGST